MDNENYIDPAIVLSSYEELDLVQTEEIVSDERAASSENGFFPKIITAILFGFIGLLPFFVLPYSGLTAEASKGIFLSAAVILSSALCLFWWLRSGNIVLPRNPIYPVLGALALTYFVSSLMSEAFNPSFYGNGEPGTTLNIILFAILVVLSGIFLRSRRNALRAVWITFLSGIVLFLFQIFHIIFPDVSALGGVLTSKTQSVIGNWSDLGIFSGMVIIISLAALQTLAIGKRGFKIFLSVVLGVALFFHLLSVYTFSWTILALVSSVFAFYFYQNRKERFDLETRRRIFSTPFFVALASIVFIFAGTWLNTQLFRVLHLSPSTDVRPSWASTLAVDRGVITSGWKDGLIGAGPNRFFTEWAKFRPVEVNMTPWWNVDFNNGIGMIPSVVATVGIIGSLLWLAFLFLFFFFGVTSLRRNVEKMDHVTRFAAIASFSVAVFLWIVLFANVAGIVIVTFAFLFTGIFISIISSIAAPPLSISCSVKKSKRGFFTVVFVLVMLMLVTLLAYGVLWQYRSVFAYRNSVAASLSGNYDSAEIQINRALSLSKNDSYYRSYAILNGYRAKQVLQKMDASPDEIRAKWTAYFTSSVNNAKMAITADPGNYLNWVVLGNAYSDLVSLKIKDVSDQALQHAEENYVAANKINPLNPGIYLVAASAFASAGKTSDSEQLLKQALALKWDYADALSLLSQVSSNAGDEQTVLPYFENAARSSPSDPTMHYYLGVMKYQAGDYQGAISALEQADSITSNYANAEYFLGLAYSKVGRVQDAIREFEKIQSTNPDRTDIVSILNNLRSGNPPFLSPIASSAVAPAKSAKKK